MYSITQCDNALHTFVTIKIHANPEDVEYSEPNPPPPSTAPPTNEEGTEDGNEEDVPTITGHWNSRLTSFQKLILIKAFREEKVNIVINSDVSCFMNYMYVHVHVL